MKIRQLKAVGHNTAYPLASGIGLTTGVYQTNFSVEAEGEDAGFFTVDVLAGLTTGKHSSEGFRDAVRAYRDALTELCVRHGIHPDDLKTLHVRCDTDRV